MNMRRERLNVRKMYNVVYSVYNFEHGIKSENKINDKK